MEKQPLLSVIIPVYNTGTFLPRCMESLKKQKYSELQIILVDDGSCDCSGELCDRYAEQEENVVVIHKENQGLGFARNSGLMKAYGEYVTFLDSDDYVDENMYAHLMTEIIEAEADAAFCDFCFVKKDGQSIYAESAIKEGKYTGKALAAAMLGAAPESKTDFDFDMSVCKGIYSRRIIEENSIRFHSERQTICEDLIFNLEVLPKAAVVVYVKQSYYYYCENAGSLTQRYIENRLLKEKCLYEQVQTVTASWLTGEGILRLHRLFLSRIRMTIRQEVFRRNSGSMEAQRDKIKEIVADDTVCKVINAYPINRNRVKLRIFHALLKQKCIPGVYILIRLNG